MKLNGENNGAKGPLLSVLIVDDDPLVVKAMNLLMSHAGFRAIVCTSGADALRRIDGDVVAAIVDIHLPDINGLELSQQLRQHMPERAPIIILSGDNSMETIRALPNAGATHFFAKPVSATMLIDFIKEQLKSNAVVKS